jgi:hypothetical protein
MRDKWGLLNEGIGGSAPLDKSRCNSRNNGINTGAIQIYDGINPGLIQFNLNTLELDDMINPGTNYRMIWDPGRWNIGLWAKG